MPKQCRALQRKSKTSLRKGTGFAMARGRDSPGLQERPRQARSLRPKERPTLTEKKRFPSKQADTSVITRIRTILPSHCKYRSRTTASKSLASTTAASAATALQAEGLSEWGKAFCSNAKLKARAKAITRLSQRE